MRRIGRRPFHLGLLCSPLVGGLDLPAVIAGDALFALPSGVVGHLGRSCVACKGNALAPQEFIPLESARFPEARAI
jgi:hypothetical protein